MNRSVILIYGSPLTKVFYSFNTLMKRMGGNITTRVVRCRLGNLDEGTELFVRRMILNYVTIDNMIHYQDVL